MLEKQKIHTVYKSREGKRLPSVTTILGILNKPALMHWAWQCGVDGLDYRNVRDNAADIGTLAHYLILCHLKGLEPDTSEYSAQDIAKAETCLTKYWDWEREHPDMEAVLVEEPLVSAMHNYGGTIDCLMRHGDEMWLVDHKTGKGIYPEMFYQLAAYKQLLTEAGYDIANARILRIGRDENEGFEERVMVELDKQFELFYNCLQIYNLQKEIGR